VVNGSYDTDLNAAVDSEPGFDDAEEMLDDLASEEQMEGPPSILLSQV
jgi:hypothetical protein